MVFLAPRFNPRRIVLSPINSKSQFYVVYTLPSGETRIGVLNQKHLPPGEFGESQSRDGHVLSPYHNAPADKAVVIVGDEGKLTLRVKNTRGDDEVECSVTLRPGYRVVYQDATGGGHQTRAGDAGWTQRAYQAEPININSVATEVQWLDIGYEQTS